MPSTIPTTMQAAVLDVFGSANELKIRTVPVPQIDSEEVLIKIEYAGVGSWDPFEREGGYAQMQGTKPAFPYILGSEGAGKIVKVGSKVTRLRVGDRVYGVGFLNPKGGFYSEYVALDAGLVSPIPSQLSVEQAAAMPGVGLTALRGLTDILHLTPEETILIFGASGAMGHVAVQLAKRIGSRVVALASGEDGVALAERARADLALNGRNESASVIEKVTEFAPEGVDKILLTAGGDNFEALFSSLCKDGLVAYPTGIIPEPKSSQDVNIQVFNGEPDRSLIKRLNELVGSEAFYVHIDHIYSLEEVSQAHSALTRHHLGKVLLRVS